MGAWGSERWGGSVPPPSIAAGCFWLVFVGCFLFWGCLGGCFVCGLVLNSYCIATVLLEWFWVSGVVGLGSCVCGCLNGLVSRAYESEVDGSNLLSHQKLS